MDIQTIPLKLGTDTIFRHHTSNSSQSLIGLPVSQFFKTESSTQTQGNRGQAAIFDGYLTSNLRL